LRNLLHEIWPVSQHRLAGIDVGDATDKRLKVQ